MEAILDGDGDFNIVDLDRCIGCGLCATTCTEDAITLIQKDKTVIPPKSNRELYQKILMKKNTPMANVKTAIKIISGKKI